MVTSGAAGQGTAELARREFLRVAGAGAVAGLAAACSRNAVRSQPTPSASSAASTLGSPFAPSSGPPTTKPPGTTRGPGTKSSASTVPPPPTSASAGAPDWKALQRSLSGTLVRPGQSSYDGAYQLFNPRFDDIRPQGVVRASNADDVAESVRFARRYGLRLAVRSGGHCYAGWSAGTGLVVDMRRIEAISTRSGTASIGAGARLVDVYQTLAGRGVGIPAGSCPTVGLAGLALGGGIGVLGRAWGLTCDNVVGAQIVTADGSLKSIDARHDADLFWAIRGGGGGTFGAVTQLTLRTRPAPSVATWFLRWPWASAAAVLAGWQRWAPGAADEVWSTCHLASAPSSELPEVIVAGTFIGPASGVDEAIAGLMTAVGSDPFDRSVADHTYAEAMLIEAGCSDKTYQQCHLAPSGSVVRQAYAASSDFVNSVLSGRGVSTIVGIVQQRHDTRGVPDVTVEFDASGGAINRVSRGATAFVHRRSVCSVQYIANWYDDTSAAAVRSATAWPHATRVRMQPYVSGEAYQNYSDPAIVNWQSAYFGGNYRRLQKVKSAYDPHNVFAHPQGVLPA
ncbi:MAG: FAD-binding oxidoreductase [Mycobacteriales bacterium]